MKGIEIFKNDRFGEVRVVGTNENPLFCLVDICKAVDIANSRNVKNRLDEDDVHLVDIIDSLGRTQQAVFVSEAGMYDAVLKSDSPKARPFSRWITHEFLPSIRKTGGYMVAKPEDTPEEIMARALTIAQATLLRKEERLKTLEIENEHKQATIELQAQELRISAPKAEYCDKVLSSKGYLTVNMIASCLGISDIKLNKLLCEWGVQYKESGTYFLYSKYRDKGFTFHKPHPYTDSNGEIKTRQHMYWTEAGKKFILDLYNLKISA